jgi:hypothetical protein
MLRPDHHTECGMLPSAPLAWAACTCGWTYMANFVRPEGAPVALKLARLRAEVHEREGQCPQ